MDGSGDPPKGAGRVRGPSRWFGTGREVLQKVRNGSGGPPGVCDKSEDPFRDLGRVEEPSRRTGMGQGTLPKVRDG